MTPEELQKLPPEILERYINEGGLRREPEPPRQSEKAEEPSVHTEVRPISDMAKEAVADHSVLTPTRADGFDFKDPVELLYLLDDDVREGHITLHNWQVRFMLDFASGKWSQDHPFQAIVRAANGSGKDKYAIAPCAMWLCMRFIQARCVITSSSGVQLDNQTDTYINQLAREANKKIAPGIWKCNYRYYECLPTGSPMLLFATDEPGKAEGYHPLRFGAKLALFESEAKTVPDEIHNAQSRCTGYTHRCLVSSPGLPSGHFYDLDTVAVDRKALENFDGLTASDYIRYHVTAYDCSHIPRSDIERGKRNLPGGETGAAFKSQYLAEFGTTDEMVVIPSIYIWKAVNGSPKEGWVKEERNKAGLDLSDGGDETVLTVRNGNKHLATIPFRFDNTQDTIDFLEQKFKEWELTYEDAYIYADCGGLGKPMLDQLKRKGWSNIRYVDNRNKPYEPRTYVNRGAELWFHLRSLFEQQCIICQRDDKLIRQLSTRYYKITAKNTHQLLSKIESRSRGYPSPDRGDSFTLAFWDYRSRYHDFVPPTDDQLPFKQTPSAPILPDLSLTEWAKRGTQDSSNLPQPSAGKDFRLYHEAIRRHNMLVASREN